MASLLKKSCFNASTLKGLCSGVIVMLKVHENYPEDLPNFNFKALFLQTATPHPWQFYLPFPALQFLTLIILTVLF